MLKKIFTPALLAASLALAACAGTPNFSEVSGKEWKLIEVRTEPENIRFDRNKLIDEGFGDIFTLNFDAGQISGKGAPNRYVAPYELGANQSMSVKTPAGTLMAPIVEPEKLKEREFFIYVENIYKWDFRNGSLELLTKGLDGREAVMVFILD
jgi:heat shock protein HslJ